MFVGGYYVDLLYGEWCVCVYRLTIVMLLG